jgi:vacuolar protein sorting-associated protein 45
VSTYQQQTKNNSKIESIEEMQRFVDRFPEFRKLSGNVSKHVGVVHELSTTVAKNHLLQVSQLEQEIACTDAKQRQLQELVSYLDAGVEGASGHVSQTNLGLDAPVPNISNMERLRLVMLWALKYENEAATIDSLKTKLLQCGIDKEQVRLVDAVLK